VDTPIRIGASGGFAAAVPGTTGFDGPTELTRFAPPEAY